MFKTTLKPVIFLILLLLCQTTAAAQTFDNVSIAGASSVCSIAQDEQGMVWFGTEHGLYAYDGYRTIPHNTTAGGTNVNTRVHSMYMRHNIIYMGTEGGLLVYDIRQGRYIYPKNDKTAQLNTGDIRAVAKHGDRLWLGGARGLFSRSIQTGEMRTENNHLHNIYSLLSTPRGLLVGTISGLWLFTGGKAQPIRIGEGAQPLVNALAKDVNGIWIGTEGALYHYDWHTMTAVIGLAGNSIKSLSLQGDNLYAGTDNGLYIYNRKTNAIAHALHDSRSPRTIANNIVWAVAADRWGNIWAGTDQGVSGLRNRRFFTLTPLSDITQTGDGNCLHLIYRSRGDMLWLGGTNGLISYHASHGLMPDSPANIAWFRQTSTTHYMSHNRVRRVYEDRDGTIIVCTDHGLNIYNPLTRQMRNVIVTDASRRYNTAWAYDIVDDGQGRYWICSYMGGVFVISKDKLLRPASATVVADRHFAGELQGIHVWQLVADGRGRIWARMYDRGLDRIDPRTMRVEHVVAGDRLVNDIYADHDGNIWAAMDGEIRCFGMKKADDRSFRVSGYKADDAALLCEVEGDIWAIIGQDCCIFSPNGMSTRFSMKGFQPLSISYDSTSKCVLFGGNDAVASVPTDNLVFFYPKPKLNNNARGGMMIANERDYGLPEFKKFFLLSGLLVDGESYVPDDGAPTYLSELTLTARQNNITFLFTDLPMAGKQPCVYAYRLEGIDHEWQYMHGERLEISYSALPPGEYTLRVCEVDGLGKTEHEVYSLRVTILPPWYLSAWAKMFYLLVVAGLVAWTMKFVIMRRRLREEREAKERVMQELSARQAFFDNLSRQLKQPLGAMFSSVLDMLHSEKDASETQRLEHMRHSIISLNTIAYRAFDMQQTADKQHTGEKITTDLVDFCRRAADDARRKYGKAVEIVFRTDVTAAYAAVDLVRMQPIVDSLIDFAVSHNKNGGSIAIGVAASGGKAVVSVDVPGLRIKSEDMPLVFNRYFTLTDDGTKHDVGVNTLALVKEFASQNSATASIGQTDDATRVSMTFETLSTTTPAHNSTLSVSRPTPPTTPDNAEARLLARITDTVEEHIADSDFNVTRLQETLGIGSKLLYRKVKQMTGKTPVEFIRHIRLQRAAMLLREGKFSVSEVMYMVGFSNSSYFSKMFQKAYGITPTEFARG